MTKFSLLILGGMLFVPTGASAMGQIAPDPAEVALQAAIKKETVDGDLQGAIERYKGIAESRNRVAAAKALLRMGQCYEKLGDPQARKAYERVLTQFPDQKDAAQEARKRLSALPRMMRLETLKPAGQPAGTIDDHRLETRVTYATGQKSVQYIVIDLAKQVGLGYNWQKSFAQTDPECRRWVRDVYIKDKPFREAIEGILRPVGLRYQVENDVIVLYRR